MRLTRKEIEMYSSIIEALDSGDISFMDGQDPEAINDLVLVLEDPVLKRRASTILFMVDGMRFKSIHSRNLWKVGNFGQEVFRLMQLIDKTVTRKLEEMHLHASNDIGETYFIPYNKGGGTIVDWDFTNPIHCFTWHDDNSGYARSGTHLYKYKPSHIRMHRMLMGFPEEAEIDHINGKRNDNRKENLRAVSVRQSAQNRIKHREGKLVGAHYDKHNKNPKKWLSRVYEDGKLKYLGVFMTEKEAHLCYLEYLFEKEPSNKTYTEIQKIRKEGRR